MSTAPPVPRILALFPGHGSQWPRMGEPLLEDSPGFRGTIEACDAWVEPRLGWSIRAELGRGPEESRLSDIVVLQLMLHSVQVALAALWRERGIEAQAVIGTSLGELAAAQVAGALSPEDALEVVRARAELVAALRPEGGAVVVNVPESGAAAMLEGLEREASLSGLNGPATTSFSGTPGAVEEILQRAEARGLFARRIRVEYPAHCRLLEPAAAPLRERIAGIRPRPTRIPFYSTVRRGVLPGEVLGPDYWVANLLEPVAASPTLLNALADGWNVVLETTPHPIFRKSVEDAIAESKADAVHCATLRREADPLACLGEAERLLAERGVQAAPSASRGAA